MNAIKFMDTGKPDRIKVVLNGRVVGMLNKMMLGWAYFPYGTKSHGDFFPNLDACKASV